MSTKDKWGSQLEFVCSCIGYSVGLGNLWRFPYVAYKNGGAAFLVPYVLINILIGRPIYYLELLLGQFSGSGPLGAFRISPIGIVVMQGNAFGMMWGAFVTTIYYQMIITYSVVYLFHSFKAPLPWTDCFEWWGVPVDGCYARLRSSRVCELISKSIVLAGGANATGSEPTAVVSYENVSVLIPVREYESRFGGCVRGNISSTAAFYSRFVLHASPSFAEVGFIQRNLVICYALCWVVIFLVVGKVVLVTATAPYIILTVLFIRGVTLPGASIGLRYLLWPRWDTIFSPDVWRAATEQTFYSLSIGTGGLLVYGGYQPFRHDIGSSAKFICLVDFITSAFSSLVVFSVLGNMAHTLDIPISDVVSAGPGLAFVTYPDALALIPFPNMWSVLFFAMLIFLGIDSQMGNTEFLVNSIQDLFPTMSTRRTLTALMYCSSCFLIGLALTTQAGLYVLTILDNYLGALIVLFTCLAETIIVGWVYGTRRFCFDITFMTGACPGYFVVITLKYLAPVTLTALLVYTLYTFPRSSVGEYILPLWADFFGWGLALVGLAPLLIIAVVRLAECGFSWQKATAPEMDWGPYDPKYRTLYHERLQEVGFQQLGYRVVAVGSRQGTPAGSRVVSPTEPKHRGAVQKPH
ncbi:hypothetical protein HPB48_002000 [Haemaphysalis longicornis]|uniref:Transporter n=1 Tax=Haemaphysalis longicornis TaxID=44386 RepID=A0A9J6FT22_HAELO|nr:hypothetical protein HPB48_002000 [Haemaphysalis longicornis]